MKAVYILMVMLVIALSASILHVQERNNSFLLEGQWEPKYIGFNHEQMLRECENHNLYYDYEIGVCENELRED